jgi:hypothetical protein
MANRRRARIIPTDSWPELQPLLLFPDQESYEVIRPVVLFGFTPLERSQETGVSARSSTVRHSASSNMGYLAYSRPRSSQTPSACCLGSSDERSSS